MGNRRIVVGVDGSAGARSALNWAADECRLRSCSLLIVHAPDPTEAGLLASGGESALRALDEVGSRMLDQYAAAASTRQSGVTVTSMLTHARAADSLIDLSADSELVVVGTRGRGSVALSMLGSASHRVAAHAHCPAAVVPQAATLPEARTADRVVVGVSATTSGRMALAFAFEEAQRRGVTLEPIRAWGTGDLVMDDSSDRGSVSRLIEQARLRAQDTMRAELELFAADFPDVKVLTRLVHGDAAAALMAAAARAQVIVLGSRHSDDRWSTRLGPVPTAILHRVGCPIVVVGSAFLAAVSPGQSAAFALQF